MSRRLLLACLLLLAAPSAAHAATAAPGGLQAAVDAAANGETITLSAAAYPDDVTFPAGKTGLVVDGSGGATLTGNLTVNATGTTFRALALSPAGSGLTVAAAGGVALDRVLATRSAGTDPIVTSAGALAITDSAVISSVGTPVAASGAATTIQRSTLATTPSGADALAVSSSTSGAKSLVADSTLFIGGAASGAGVRATTTGLAAGDLAVTLRHVTVGGSNKGVVLDSSGASGSGNIAAAVTGSIVHPPSTATSNTLPLVGNTATLSVADTDAPGQPLSFQDAQVFGANFHLRADAPVIGKGGALANGESTTDIDGQPRPNPTDAGADQFVNGAPTTTLALANGVVDEGQPVSATLSPKDPDAGDTYSVYAFDWGDGQQTVGTSPTASHTYAKPGTFTVKGAVADARSAVSNIAIASATVRDVSAPVTKVSSPKNGQKLKYEKSRRLTVKGTDTDATGVAKVELALTRKAGKRCFQYGTKTFKKAKCSKYTWRRAKLVNTSFSLRTRKGATLAKGAYTLRIRSTDGAGNRSKGFSRKGGTLVRFSVK